MSFSDRPGYGSWQHVLGFVLAFFLVMVNLLVFAGWLLSFYDLSTEEVRSLHWLDFVVVPGTLLLTLGIIKLHLRYIVRD